MFIYSIVSLFVAVVAGILGLTVFAGVTVAAAQLILVAAWIAFMIFTLMGSGEPAPAAYQPVKRSSDLRPDQRTRPS